MGNGVISRFEIGFRYLDLFSGIGGFRLALDSLGGKCVMSSEIDRRARAAYHANFTEWPRGDVRAIRDEEFPEHDILCGGFPCQSFSIAGKKLGFEDEIRGTLFFEIIRFLKARRPAVAFLENVAHLLVHDGGRTFAIIKRELENSGYEVTHQILNASLFGAPTARKRVYIVAFRSDLNIHGFFFPEPLFTPAKLADVLLPDTQTDRWVVRDHPVVLDEEAVAEAERGPALGLIKVGRCGDKKLATQGNRIYSANGHAITFCAKSGGVGAKTGLYHINGRTRKLAPRECLRVMGFPDTFTIPPSVSPEQCRSLVGNSVVVPVIRLIAERILAALGGAQSVVSLPDPSMAFPSSSAPTHAHP